MCLSHSNYMYMYNVYMQYIDSLYVHVLTLGMV